MHYSGQKRTRLLKLARLFRKVLQHLKENAEAVHQKQS